MWNYSFGNVARRKWRKCCTNLMQKLHLGRANFTPFPIDSVSWSFKFIILTRASSLQEPIYWGKLIYEFCPVTSDKRQDVYGKYWGQRVWCSLYKMYFQRAFVEIGYHIKHPTWSYLNSDIVNFESMAQKYQGIKTVHIGFYHLCGNPKENIIDLQLFCF